MGPLHRPLPQTSKRLHVRKHVGGAHTPLTTRVLYTLFAIFVKENFYSAWWAPEFGASVAPDGLLAHGYGREEEGKKAKSP